jgi:rod shape-determining protein MreC
VLYAALSLLLLLTGDRLPVAALRAAGAFLFEPFDRLVLAGDRMMAAWSENQVLHERVTRLEVENRQLRGAIVENRVLRAELGLPDWRAIELRPVEVLALAGDPLPYAATLSAGAREGVRVGDAVVTSEGLVGRVTEVYPSLARASLLTDANHAVACVVESTGVNGILRFTPAPYPRMVLTSVPLSDTMRVGQMVVTSELSVRYPRGIPVGRIHRVTADASGLLQEAEVQPMARLSRLRHAFVAPRPGAYGDSSATPPYVTAMELTLLRRRLEERRARERGDSLAAARARADSLARMARDSLASIADSVARAGARERSQAPAMPSRPDSVRPAPSRTPAPPAVRPAAVGRSAAPADTVRRRAPAARDSTREILRRLMRQRSGAGRDTA